MRTASIIGLVLCLGGCASSGGGEPKALRAPPRVTAKVVADLAAWLAKAEVSERLGSKASPWVTKDGLTTSLPLPTGFRGLRVQLPAVGNETLEVGPLRLAPVGASASALELEGNRAVYRNLYPSTDAVLVNGPEWVEQLWVLRGPAAPTRFEWEVGRLASNRTR